MCPAADNANRRRWSAGVRAFGLRLPIVLATMAAVLAMLFGVQFLLQRQAFALPLATRLRETPGVVGEPTITSESDGLHVDVHLGAVSDLRATYEALLAAADTSTGQHVILQIEDTRTPALTADYYQLNAILVQGRATGQYVGMQQQFEQTSQKLGLDTAQVVLGNSQMFITLASGGHYLYQIVPLTLAGSAAGGAA